MKYKSYLEKIVEALNAKKSTVDKLVELFDAEKLGHKEKLKSMRGIYTQEFIDEYTKQWTPAGNYAEAITKSSEKALAEVTHYCECIKKELDRYFDVLVRPEFANQINSLISTQMPLLDREFQALADSAQNYMELRLVKNFAESRTNTKTKAVTNEHGITTNVEVTEKNPYNITIPDIDFVYREFDNLSASVKQFATCYVGMNCELKEFLDNSISDYAPLSAINVFRSKTIDKFTETMEKANAVLPENKIKKELTESDRKFIDTVINPTYPILAETTVKELAKNKADSELVELLRLDERYAKYIEEVEGEAE